MTDIFDRIEQTSSMMMEAYQAFQDVIAELGESRDFAEHVPAGQPEVESNDERLVGSDDRSDDEFNHDVYEGEGARQGYEMFPGRKFFRPEDLDMEDPKYWGGFELGIPVSMTVHYSTGQHREVTLKK